MRQISTPRGEYVEKIIRDAAGELVRATFWIYEDHGRIKARLVSAVLVEEKRECAILALSCLSVSASSSEIFLTHPIVSPHLSYDLLHIAGSKPRAPTHY